MQDYLFLQYWQLQPLLFGYTRKHHQAKNGLRTCNAGKKQINMKVSEFSIKEYTGEQNSNQMGNFEESRKAKEERKERDKASRENLGKFFYDLAKLSFATLVIGSTASVIIQENNLESWIIISIGAFVTYIFAYIGYKIIK